jgi:Fe-S-cluster-containing dehydrogenase component
MVACPYNARYFREDTGVVEKCTFCAHRVDRGEVPACVETCPSKARVFGDIMDANGELQRLLTAREYRQKKPLSGNGPQIYYLI